MKSMDGSTSGIKCKERWERRTEKLSKERYLIEGRMEEKRQMTVD